MSINTKTTYHFRGFTIVELLIVIVVIAVLASITVVAYNSIQSRAKDTSMRSSMAQLERSIRSWNANTGELPIGGWGSTASMTNGKCSDGTGGWIFSGAYTCSLEDVLVADGFLPAGFTRRLPTNESLGWYSNGSVSTMFYRCGSTSNFALYWYLSDPTSQDSASLAAAEAQGCPTGPRSHYSMRAAKMINF